MNNDYLSSIQINYVLVTTDCHSKVFGCIIIIWCDKSTVFDIKWCIYYSF